MEERQGCAWSADGQILAIVGTSSSGAKYRTGIHGRVGDVFTQKTQSATTFATTVTSAVFFHEDNHTVIFGSADSPAIRAFNPSVNPVQLISGSIVDVQPPSVKGMSLWPKVRCAP